MRRSHRLAAIGLAAVLAATLGVGCAGGASGETADAGSAHRRRTTGPTPTTRPTTTSATPTVPATTAIATPAPPPITQDPAPVAAPAPAVPDTTLAPAAPQPSPYDASSSPIDAATAARMASSWRPGCPVGLVDLRLLRLPYHGLDGTVHTGEMVVHADVADTVIGVFHQVFEAGFPIERMQIVDAYGGDDVASMEANNTSAFNCRPATGSDRWSEHAYGRAIDVNPRMNLYVDGGYVSPPSGAPYADRSRTDPGMIHEGDAVVRAFDRAGWGWGGRYRSLKDYQHFSASGR